MDYKDVIIQDLKAENKKLTEELKQLKSQSAAGDLISRSALREILEKSLKENNHKTSEGYAVHMQEHRHLIHLVEKQPTVNVFGFPCKVGDVVELTACCECISNVFDRGTGAFDCPFENDCEFDECNNGNERRFRTTIESIYDIGNSWHASLKHINIEIPLCDFTIGTNIRVVKEEGADNEP